MQDQNERQGESDSTHSRRGVAVAGVGLVIGAGAGWRFLFQSEDKDSRAPTDVTPGRSDTNGADGPADEGNSIRITGVDSVRTEVFKGSAAIFDLGIENTGDSSVTASVIRQGDGIVRADPASLAAGENVTIRVHVPVERVGTHQLELGVDADGESVSADPLEIRGIECTVEASQNYPQAGYDNQNTGLNPDAIAFRSPDEAPTRLWEADVSADVNSDPVLYRGVLYVPAGPALHALDACTGEPLWRANFDNDVEALAAGNDLVYVGLSSSGMIQALAPDSGDTVAQHAVDGHTVSAIVLHDGAVYANANDPTPGLSGNVAFVRLSDRLDPQWQLPDPPQISDLVPTITDDSIVISRPERTSCFDHDGNERWEVKSEFSWDTHSVHDGYVYLGCQGSYTDGQLTQISVTGGTVTNRYSDRHNGIDTPPVIKDMTVIAGGDGGVCRFDTNLQLLSILDTEESVSATPVVTDERIYGLDTAGKLTAWDRSSQTSVWTHDLPTGDYYRNPILANGFLFAVSNEGQVTALY